MTKRDPASVQEVQALGFGHEIGFGERPALIIIDVTRAFADPNAGLGADLDAEIGVINRCIRAARAKGIPVIFTTIEYVQPDLSDAGLWGRKMKHLREMQAGTSGPELEPRLYVQSTDDIIVKKYASSFFGTDLASRLTSRGVDTLVITGCTTSGCVRATAVDALQLGFRPIVVRDAVGDRWSAAHEQSLYDMQAKYADVLDSSDVIKHLECL